MAKRCIDFNPFIKLVDALTKIENLSKKLPNAPDPKLSLDRVNLLDFGHFE